MTCRRVLKAFTTLIDAASCSCLVLGAYRVVTANLVSELLRTSADSDACRKVSLGIAVYSKILGGQDAVGISLT